MKIVTADFRVFFDYSETIQEMINDGEFNMTEEEIRDYVLSLVMEDLQDLSLQIGDVKNQTYIQVAEIENES